MDKENLQLLILTIFGISGFFLFVLLLVFCDLDQHDEEESTKQKVVNHGKSTTEKRSSCANKEEISCDMSKSPAVLRDIPFLHLKAATGNFCGFNLLQAGHSGDLYLGALDGTKLVGVKRFEPHKTDTDHYGAELDVYDRVPNHRCFVPLLGYCAEGQEKLLVYKHMPNGDLATALAMPRSSIGSEDEASGRELPWIVRLKIAIGVAEALVFLHHGGQPAIAHRNFDIKLGGLSEAQSLEEGSMPVYDVYCFGKVLLDLISGLNVSGSIDSLTKAWMLKALPLISMQTKDLFLELTDPSMILDEDLEKELLGVALLAKACMDAKVLQKLSMITVLDCLRNPQNLW